MAEACLWKYVLSKRRVKGYQFRRQRPIDNYIADFACLPLKLIIEVDGPIHNEEDVAKNDIIRQKRLEDLGFRVIRFTNDEVLTAIQSVYERIEDVVMELEMMNGWFLKSKESIPNLPTLLGLAM